jgi:hypothetical protein
MKHHFKYLMIMAYLLTACQKVDNNSLTLKTTNHKEPILIVNKNRHLNIAEFWINKIKEPNKIIMNEKEIKIFNDHIAYKQKKLNYFNELNESYDNLWIKEKIFKGFHGIQLVAHYFEDGSEIPKSFYADIEKRIAIERKEEENTPTRYALTINYTNQKIIPTKRLLLKKSSQIHFDRNQNSALDIATPLAIIHSSKDGLWHYGIGPTSSGWVRDEDIAFGDKEEILSYLKPSNFIVTTAAKTAVLIEGRYHDYMRMGVRLPLVTNNGSMSEVMVPQRDKKGKLLLTKASVKKENVHEGYLAYTQKNILSQAFKFLNAPYGWGGMYGEQDCSKFIQEIYATTGLKLPRNSASQSEVGDKKIELESLVKKAKHHLLKRSALAGVSIVHLKGHIVLYLGEYENEPYIIHTVWGGSSTHFPLARTAVTSLNFNNYLNKIDRITNITLK